MKKIKFFYVIGTLLLLVASSLQCDDSELAQLPYIPESETAIHSKTFPLIWKTRVQDGEQVSVRGSWMTEDMRIDLSQGKTVFLDSPAVESSPAHHTFTVYSSNANCTKTYDLTFTTPLSSSVAPASLYMKQTFATYGGSPVDLSAMFQEDGTVKVDISVRGCSPYSKTFPIRHFDQGHTWQNFLDEMNFTAAAAEGQSWGYQTFPSKCDAAFNKIVLSDTFIQPAEQVHNSVPLDTEPRLQTPTFSASMVVDDYSCSGARTAYASSVAALAANLGQVICEAMNMTEECYIGHMRKPLPECPAGTAPAVATVQPRPSIAVVQDNSTTKKDNSASAAAIILIVLLCGVALLVLSILGVWISKRFESLRRKNPPAAVEMFIQSEDQIFTVADDRTSDVESI